ncbi:phage regulatory CII family protein [Endozoicomonas ascidiicola]|uniref:phage regulatory CII family protein n=1 Tax=Endozoicomonas ascidiicola TaxID=1698521 RepID=UPI0008296676|nr:phage regulatory CII family protein [Endozoicomonas ascidiicola]
MPTSTDTARPDFSLVLSAIRKACEQYPGGTNALSLALGKGSNTLANELNPAMSSHKLGLFDALTLLSLLKDPAPLRAIAAILNHTIIPLGDFSTTSDVELLNAYAKWHAEIGDVAREVSKTLEDGRIEMHEYQRILKEGLEQVQQFFLFMNRLEALIDG